jgi:hypothetical protein
MFRLSSFNHLVFRKNKNIFSSFVQHLIYINYRYKCAYTYYVSRYRYQFYYRRVNHYSSSNDRHYYYNSCSSSFTLKIRGELLPPLIGERSEPISEAGLPALKGVASYECSISSNRTFDLSRN